MKNMFSDIESSSGLGKAIYTLLWPIRKFYIVVPILALLYVTPVFFEANPRKVHIWYRDKAAIAIDEAKSVPFIAKSINAIGGLFGVEEKIVVKTKTDKNKLSKNLVEMHKPRSKVRSRKSFEVSNDTHKFELKKGEKITSNNEYASANEELQRDTTTTKPLKEEVAVAISEEEINKHIDLKMLPKSDTSKFNIRTKKKLPLIYLDVPKDIEGIAKIVNGNELIIDDMHILLYGIYSHPLTPDGQKSTSYLEETTKDMRVKCSIVAYTYQQVPTAICFVGEENLNESLVKLGITKNIAI